MIKSKIFYVEDDETLAFLTKDHLEQSGYTVTQFSDGVIALNSFKKNHYDICILDVMLPRMDGFKLAETIRKINNSIPIIFLTAKSMIDDKLTGLNTGGDDYILKPFDIRELLKKIEIFLERRSKNPNLEDTEDIQIGKYIFKYLDLKLNHNEEILTLTQKEADLLRYFVRHKNTLIKRSEILEELWGRNDYFLGRSLDVFISRLRKYLHFDENIKIENVHGVGFRFLITD